MTNQANTHLDLLVEVTSLQRERDELKLEKGRLKKVIEAGQAENVDQRRRLDELRVLKEAAEQALSALREDNWEVYAYLSRLFTYYVPQCEPLSTLLGVCTQIDNLLVGLSEKACNWDRLGRQLLSSDASEKKDERP